MIATLDTNVLVSAVLFKGVPHQVFMAAIERHYTLAISATILDEFRGVLSRPKFGLPAPLIHVLVSDVESAAVLMNPAVKHQLIDEDPDDNAIVDCAVESKSDFIVSGDRHLLLMKTVAGIPVVPPTTFEEKLQTHRRGKG